MPIFEYNCTDCNQRFEELVLSSAAAADPHCPQCDGEAVEKVYSTFAAQAKGADPCAGGFCEPAAAPGMCGPCGGPGPCAVN